MSLEPSFIMEQTLTLYNESSDFTYELKFTFKL